MQDIAIELLNVSKRFPAPGGGEVLAVDQISLNVYDGEFFSLLGPSGCGKTTTLRMIAGFELPTAGEIRIHGKSMGSTPPFKRPVNTVFQHYALFPHMSVGENVGFGLEMKGVSKVEIGRQVAEALEMVRLSGLEKRQPGQLSGGQQQRVAVARALINRPEVLLLDEPLGALDLKLRKEMQLELKTLQRDVGITFIYVTHDQEEALTMSDRIAVMNHGVVLQVGTPTDIYEHPEDRFVADFIGESNFIDAIVQNQDGEIVELLLEGEITVRAVARRQLARGQKVILAIRPEKMSLHGGLEAANCLSARVEEMIYIGTDTNYLLRLEGGQSVRVREQNSLPSANTRVQIGEQINIWFLPAAARALVE